MKVLPVELTHSYSWSQDRRSMEYSVENQIANKRIAMGEEQNSAFIKILSWTQNFVTVHSFNFKGKIFQLEFGQCNLLLAMWHVISVMSHVQTSNMWNIIYYRDILNICLLVSLFWIYIQKPLLKPKYVWGQTPHLVASTSIRGWNLYPNTPIPSTKILTLKTVSKNIFIGSLYVSKISIFW